MSQRQRIALFITALVIFIGVPVVWWAVSQINTDTNTVVDRDTGETFNPTVNNYDTGGGSASLSDVTLFGIEPLVEKLMDSGASTDYIATVRKALWKFSENRLKDKFDTITLRPDADISESKIESTVRLGQTDTILPILISINSTGREAIVTINKDGSEYGGTFVYVGGLDNPDNLLFTITQVNDTSSDLSIQSYGNYTNAALEYLEEIGYRVPDLTITFPNKENPFHE